MSERIVRTASGTVAQVSAYLGLDYEQDEFTTLNERLEIQQDAVIPLGSYPKGIYYAIGNGGHKSATGSDGFPSLDSIMHDPLDTGLYNIMPFVLRTLDNDLTPTDRAKYALRRQETHGGVLYWAYYLRRIDMTDVSVSKKIKLIQNGIPTLTDYVPEESRLRPEPQELSSLGVNDVNGKYLIASAILPTSWTQQECQEYLDVALIMKGDTRYAIISELAYCHGVDKIITLSDASNFKEAICVQIASHIARIHQIKYTPTGIDGFIEVGSDEALLVIE